MIGPVPAVLDAMLALVAAPSDGSGVRAGTAVGLEGVQVFDGPPLDAAEIGDVLALGVSVEDVTAAFGDERPGFGSQRSETHDVACLVQSASGEVDMKPVRDRADALLGAFREVLQADPHLSGACDWARVVRSTYRAVQDEKGALALITFTVRVDATRYGS